MPLQFADPTLPAANYKGGGSQGGFSAIAETYSKNKRQAELDRAYAVINTGEDVDNRPFLQRAIDKASGNEFVQMTPDAALNTIKRYDPKTWSVIQETQIKMEKQQRDAMNTFGKDAYQAIQTMKGMTPEQRTEQAPMMLQGLADKNPLFADKINSLDLDQDGIFSNEELAKGEGYLSSWAGEQQDKWETVEVDGKPILRNKITVEEKKSPREDKQSDSEFERLLESSGFSAEKKQELRATRLTKMAQGGSGFALSVDKDGNVMISEDGAGGLTKAHASKALAEFKTRRVNARKFINLSNSVMDSVSGNATQLGVTGAIARVADEVKSVAQNIGNEFKIDTSEVSKSIDDYDFGSLPAQSAKFKTDTLTLALIFAVATGLGEGRSLTNQDVQRSIDSIGASTNSPSQFIARIKTIQKNMDAALRIESDEWGYEYEGIPELRDKPETTSSMPAGWDPEDWKYLTAEEQAQLLNNNGQ